MTTDISALPERLDIHAHIGNAFNRALVFANVDVTAQTWAVTAPLEVATSGTTTLILTVPGDAGPMVSRWTLRMNGTAVIAGTLRIDAASFDDNPQDAITVTVEGAIGPPGPAGAPGVNPEWWAGSQTAYNALGTYGPATLYVITGP